MLSLLDIGIVKSLVAGAAGFIGSHLVKELVREKRSVRALVLPGEEELYAKQ